MTACYTKRARGAVLWGAAAFAVANFGLAVALETKLPQLRDPEFGYRQVRAREQQRRHPDRPLVLVMGTSRTANGVDPAAADFPDEPGSPLLFNVGLSGGSPVHLRSRLAALRDAGVEPRVVLVELFLASLAPDASADQLCAPTAPKLTAAEVNRLEPHLAGSWALRGAWARARLNPFGAQRLVIMSHVMRPLLPWQQRLDHYWRNTTARGFGAYPEQWAIDNRARLLEATRATYRQRAGEASVGPHADAAVRALVADCRARGTPVAFFTAPESPEFRSWYTPESRARLDAYTQQLTTELGVPVFEASDDYAEGDFADGHHLLPRAAARFTRELAERHLKPWLATLSIGGRP